MRATMSQCSVSLNEAKLMDELGFEWEDEQSPPRSAKQKVTKNMPIAPTKERKYGGNSKSWYQCYEELARFSKVNGNVLVPPRISPRNHPHAILTEFIVDMRHQYSFWSKGLKTNLTGGQKVLLDGLKFGWHADSTGAIEIGTSSNAGKKNSDGNQGGSEVGPNSLRETSVNDQQISADENNSWEVYVPQSLPKIKQEQEESKANASQVDEDCESDDEYALVF